MAYKSNSRARLTMGEDTLVTDVGGSAHGTQTSSVWEDINRS